MKCTSYKQFNNLFTRRLNKIFRNQKHRVAMNLIAIGYQCDIEEGHPITDTILDRLKRHLDVLGDGVEQKACNELIELMADNPEYKAMMHDINTRRLHVQQ